ncbi:MAG: hypothetical protein GXO43_05955 [Crenarchaeota archaeon]|nr:hypothetical protein [Thermoproteota archaeon]
MQIWQKIKQKHQQQTQKICYETINEITNKIKNKKLEKYGELIGTLILYIVFGLLIIATITAGTLSEPLADNVAFGMLIFLVLSAFLAVFVAYWIDDEYRIASNVEKLAQMMCEEITDNTINKIYSPLLDNFARNDTCNSIIFLMKKKEKLEHALKELKIVNGKNKDIIKKLSAQIENLEKEIQQAEAKCIEKTLQLLAKSLIEEAYKESKRR